MAAALAAGVLVCGVAAPAAAGAGGQGVSQPQIERIPRPSTVTLAVLPPGTTVEELALVPGISPGVLSAGIGQVPAAQTFLDISEGNRVNQVLYDRALAPLAPAGARVPAWAAIVDRAQSAPADIVPGLLASELRAAHVRVSAEQGLGARALAAADRQGVLTRFGRGDCIRSRCLGLSVMSASLVDLAALAGRLERDDLLIGLASPPPGENAALAIGFAGRGFSGDLTSDSTRTPGYVLSTDIAPTILRRFDLPIPDQMSGEPIRAEGAVDPGALQDRAARMEVIPGRRTPVVVGCLAGWIVVAAALALLARPLRFRALAWLGLVIAYMPLMLLAGAALQPAALTEAVVVGFGAAALAALTLIFVPGWASLAIAGSVTTLAYAVDVVAGSRLTALSLLGPDPGLGVRFYGIGNELEALIAVMVPAAVGAALTALAGRGRIPSRRAAIAAFLGVGALAAGLFGAGRFGADVGAAVVLPLGAAVAALSVAWSEQGAATRRSRAWRIGIVVIAAPLAGLAGIALIDLISGGNAHLTRSVLDAGGAGNLADVAERRLRLSAHDYAQAAGSPLFWVVIAAIAAGLISRRTIGGWFTEAPMARAGLLGGCAAVAVGVLVNDSGASYLVIGGVAVGALIAYGWSQMPRGRSAQSGK